MNEEQTVEFKEAMKMLDSIVMPPDSLPGENKDAYLARLDREAIIKKSKQELLNSTHY